MHDGLTNSRYGDQMKFAIAERRVECRGNHYIAPNATVIGDTSRNATLVAMKDAPKPEPKAKKAKTNEPIIEENPA